MTESSPPAPEPSPLESAPLADGPAVPPLDDTVLPPLPGVITPAGGAPLWKCLGVFTGVSILLWVIYQLLQSVISSVSVIAIMVPFFAAMSTVDYFVKNYRRVPDKAERWWLIWWSFGVLIAWSVIVGLVLFVLDSDALLEMNQPDLVLLGMLLVLGAAISFLSVWAGYSFMPKRSVKNRRRYEERRAAKGR